MMSTSAEEFYSRGNERVGSLGGGRRSTNSDMQTERTHAVHTAKTHRKIWGVTAVDGGHQGGSAEKGVGK